MTQIQVSFDEETLREVLLGDRGAEVLLEKVMNEILQAEMTEHLGAEPGKQTERRQGYRNGAYERTLTTRIGQQVRILEDPFLDRPSVRFPPAIGAHWCLAEGDSVNTGPERQLQGTASEVTGGHHTSTRVTPLCRAAEQEVSPPRRVGTRVRHFQYRTVHLHAKGQA